MLHISKTKRDIVRKVTQWMKAGRTVATESVEMSLSSSNPDTANIFANKYTAELSLNFHRASAQQC